MELYLTNFHYMIQYNHLLDDAISINSMNFILIELNLLFHVHDQMILFIGLLFWEFLTCHHGDQSFIYSLMLILETIDFCLLMNLFYHLTHFHDTQLIVNFKFIFICCKLIIFKRIITIFNVTFWIQLSIIQLNHQLF